METRPQSSKTVNASTPAAGDKHAHEKVSCRETATDSGLQLQFRQASLDSVLNYLRDAAGFIIHVKPNVPVTPPVDLWHEEPLQPAQAVNLLREDLTRKGCAIIQRGRWLSVIRSQDLKKSWIPLPAI